MKKINSIKHLKAEKKRLADRRAELEKAMKYDWRDVKDSMKPMNLASQFLSGFTKPTENAGGRTFIADSLSVLAARLVKGVVGRAEGKIGSLFKR